MCTNYRGTEHLCTVSKLAANILGQKVIIFVKPVLEYKQCGFR
jgi:glutaredoxin-related protein